MSWEEEHKIVEEYVINKINELDLEINALPVSNRHKYDCVAGLATNLVSSYLDAFSDHAEIQRAFLSSLLAAADNPPPGPWCSHEKH